MPPEQPVRVHPPRKTWFLSSPTIRRWMLAMLAVNGVGLLTLAVLGASRPVAANRTGNDAVAEALAPLPPVVVRPSVQATSNNPPPAAPAPTQQASPKPRATKPTPKQPTTPKSATQQSTTPKPPTSTQSPPSAGLVTPQVKPAQPPQPTINPPTPAKTTPSTPQARTNKPIAQPPSTNVQRTPQSTSSVTPQSAKPTKTPSDTAKARATPSGTVKSGQPKPAPSKPTPSKPAQPSRTTPSSPIIAAKPTGQNTDQPKATYQEEQAAVKELAPCALVVDTRQLWPQFQPSATPNIFSRQGQLLWPPRSLTADPSEPVPDGIMFFARTEEAARELAGTEPDQIRAISSLTTNSGGTDNEAVVVDDADADRVSGLPDHCRVVFLR